MVAGREVLVCPKRTRRTVMPQTINTNTTLTQVQIAAQKAKIIATYQALIDGINAQLADTTAFVIAGVSYAKADLVGHLQSRIDAARKVVAERTALHASVANERTMAKSVATLRGGFKSYLQGRYGKASPELQKFGFTPQKAAQKAAATKAKTVKQIEATRKARGTTGKKAKANIKGVVPADTAPNAGAAGASGTTPAAAPAAAPAVAKPSTSNPGATT
jgi:hypothetical protein